MSRWRNWSGVIVCTPRRLAIPADEAELAAIILAAREAGECVRPVGAGHSFTPLCATDGVQVSVSRFTGLRLVDQATGRVRVGAGTRLGELGAALHDHGLAMPNLGDIDVQCLAGALATGTHGTGVAFGNLATQVTGMRLVGADGQARWCSADNHADIFHAGRIHLGALGVVTEVELACVPTYRLHYRSGRIGWDDMLAGLEARRATHRNVEYYWFPYTDTVQLKTMDETRESPRGGGRWRRWQDLLVENGGLWVLSRLARARPASCPRLNRIAAAGVPRHDQIAPAHAAYATARLVRFNETEYSLPRAALPEVLRAIRTVIERDRFATNFPLEIRDAAADDVPLSPAYGRDSAYIAAHVHARMPFTDYFTALGEIFRDHGGRPHWGKWHDEDAGRLASRYPAWRDFEAVRKRLDPDGVFLNPHLYRVLVGSG
ncbi:D-arabinono-1,4-lactone oxidase [Spectribacter hydrogenooxidans]|uniref:D-arabinono-1,4-lactone oxidase n=1 Tax=Spectribacter hydrogenoxidans TaxID=3075608 RepID=A0ABU3C1L7_9GAMM|nr:D-arabinono-1,4-lactone oxidase [Salinisphaera sp. W335]MDT0635254.1 D-arabinono-1,4-lactone oxidase [Salinisphaera sp. W335]